MKEKIKEIVYRAIREVAGTDDPYRYEVKEGLGYDIAVRAVEIAMGEREKGGEE
jgi:hypothetical protein